MTPAQRIELFAATSAKLLAELREVALLREQIRQAEAELSIRSGKKTRPASDS
jgi:hypothetical protein